MISSESTDQISRSSSPEDGNAERNKQWLFLLDSLGIGGSERKTIAVANILAQRGWKIHLAFLNLNYDVRDTLAEEIETLYLGRKGKLDRHLIHILRDYIVSNEIQVVWSVNLYPMLYAFLVARKLRDRLQLIGSSNVSVFRNRYEAIKMFIYVPMIRNLDRFVFGSDAQMRAWIRKYKLNAQNFTFIHNGVDLEKFSANHDDSRKLELQAQFGVENGEIVIGMVAQFRPEKAHTDLLHATKNLLDRGRKIKLLLVGEGTTTVEVAELAEQLEISSAVIFAGLLDDVRPALQLMDVFVLPSVAVETFSNAALEAMAMGVPVVLSDIGGAREMVSDGVNGYIYPPGDIDSLTEKLMLMTEIGVCDEMGRAARTIVENRFSLEEMADHYEQVIAG